ncbi:MAG: hypothetical protein AAB373_02780 [Patescibacteria group bacterium]
MRRKIPWFYIIVGLVAGLLTEYIGYRLYVAEKLLIPLSILAILLGLMLEYRRITKSWKTVFETTLIAYLMSLLAFAKGKNEGNYDFEHHITLWPYYFYFIFIILVLVRYAEKITPKLTEGITLLQSVALIYWVWDFGFIEHSNIYIKVLMGISLLFPLFSFFHAFSYRPLSKKSRLLLSVLSSLIMLIFAAENIYHVHQIGLIENAPDLLQKIYIGAQYFLLGVSSIYIAENLTMLVEFLPGKGSFFNQKYFEELDLLQRKHVKRYSEEQVRKFHAFLLILFTSAIFGLNHYYQFVSRNFIIWVVFATFPIFIYFYERLTTKKVL